MSLIVWGVIFAAVICFAYLTTRMASRAKEDSLRDTGLAILEFGRAFPSEAIRQLQATADGQGVFVRLHDNKAGFMRNLRSHFACHLIEPGTVRVTSTTTGRGLAIEFIDAPFHNGTFEFGSAAEAAEVSLWLLGNYVSGADRDAPTDAAATTGDSH